MNYDIMRNINIIKNSIKKQITKTRGGCSSAAHRHEPPLLDNNLSSQQQITPYSVDFPSLSSTNSDLKLTLTLIIITDLLSVLKTRIDSDLFWIVKCEISVVYIVCTCKASKIGLHQSTATSTWWCGPRPVWVGSK